MFLGVLIELEYNFLGVNFILVFWVIVVINLGLIVVFVKIVGILVFLIFFIKFFSVCVLGCFFVFILIKVLVIFKL